MQLPDGSGVQVREKIENTSMAIIFLTVVDDELVELTALEYRLLLIFAANKSTLLSRNQILEKIWDTGENFVEDNTLTVYVKRLREKLGSAIHIEIVRGDWISCGLKSVRLQSCQKRYEALLMEKV